MQLDKLREECGGFGIFGHGEAAAHTVKHVEEKTTIVIPYVNVLPAVSPGSDEVQRTGELKAKRPSHRSKCSLSEEKRKT